MNAASFGLKKMSDFKTFQESQHHVYIITLYEDVLLIPCNNNIIHIRKTSRKKETAASYYLQSEASIRRGGLNGLRE